MKSRQQTTGLTVEEHKEGNITNEILCYYEDHKLADTDKELESGKLNVKIKRYDVRTIVNRELKKALGKTPDDRTICKYIRGLLADGVLIQNPTSHIHTDPKTKKQHIKQTDDTLFFIDPEIGYGKLKAYGEKIREFQAEKNAIHTPKFNLMTYIDQQSNAHQNNANDSEPNSSYSMN